MEKVFSEFLRHIQYNTHGILNVTAGLFDISVGAIVLLSNPKSKLNRAFFFLTLSTAIWVICFGLQNLVVNRDIAFVFQSLAYLGVPFIPTCFFFFSSIWTGKALNARTVIGWLSWSGVAMILMVLYPNTLVGMQEFEWGIFPHFGRDRIGWAYAIFLLVPFVTNAGLTFLNILDGMRNAVSPRERIQFRNFLIGYVIAYMGMIDFIAAFQFPVYPAGFFFLTVFIGIVAYTIARHQIFDINILVRKFVIIVLIYIGLLAAWIPLSPIIFSGIDPKYLPNIVVLGLIIGICLSFGPFIYAGLLRHTFWLRSHSSTGLTHELKSPIGSIQSAIEVLLSHHTDPNPDQTKTFDYLHIIERNTQRLELFANDLLKLAKIQNDDVTLEKSLTDFNALINETIDSYQPTAKQKGIDIRFQPIEISNIEIDRSRIQQVISNLISNAIKFSKSGDIHIKVSKQGRILICSVQDVGLGIPKEDQPKIFTRFFQGKHAHKGAGIGLTIAKAWVEAHGGKIWAESEGEGKGTKVTFTLPIE